MCVCLVDLRESHSRALQGQPATASSTIEDRHSGGRLTKRLSHSLCVLQNGRNTLFRREGRLREGEREWKRVRDERDERFECLKQY